MVDVMLRFGVMAVMAMSLLQDPTTSLPDAYKVQFENNYVRVVRVHYDAGAKLAEHTHPGGTTVYVYLNDSEGVVLSRGRQQSRGDTSGSHGRRDQIASGGGTSHSRKHIVG
jgi:hypothetical protein